MCRSAAAGCCASSDKPAQAQRDRCAGSSHGCDGACLRARQDKNNRETNGFKSRMGAAAPRPRLLRLRPEDAAKVGGAPMRQGKFTWVTEAGRQERWIVASCGNHTVLWNFRCALSPLRAAATSGGAPAGRAADEAADPGACLLRSTCMAFSRLQAEGWQEGRVCVHSFWSSRPSGACGRPPSAPLPATAPPGRTLPGLSDPGRRSAAHALKRAGAHGAGR